MIAIRPFAEAEIGLATDGLRHALPTDSGRCQAAAAAFKPVLVAQTALPNPRALGTGGPKQVLVPGAGTGWSRRGAWSRRPPGSNPPWDLSWLQIGDCCGPSIRSRGQARDRGMA